MKLDELLSDMDEKNFPEMLDWGPPVGREIGGSPEFSMTQRSPSRRKGTLPDLAAEFEVVNSAIEEAVRIASARLKELGVRHLLVGGLAVGAYARPRATKDVDFLVGQEAWPSEGKIVSPIAGLPFRVGNVVVDSLLPPPEAPTLEEAFARPNISEGIPVAPLEVIALMKLIAGRPQDRADLHALLEVAPLQLIRDYVAMHAPDYLDDLETAWKGYARSS